MISSAAQGVVHARRMVAAQSAIGLAAAGVGLVLYGTEVAIALLAGGAIALTNGLLLAWRMRGNRHTVRQSAQRHLWVFYLSSVERFLAVLVLLALSLGPLNMKPLPLILGFVLGQLALVFSTLILRKIE